jgi:hypothetical protein
MHGDGAQRVAVSCTPAYPSRGRQVPGQETLAFGRSQYIFGKWRIHRQARQYDTPSRAHAPI